MQAAVSAALGSGFREFRDFVNPLIYSRAELTQEPLRLVSTAGGALVDEEGRRIEDFHGTQAFGHRHPAITAAVRDFLDSPAPNWFPSRVNPFAGQLARKLCERSGHYTSVYFGCSGADAVEAALKLGRALTRRRRVLGLCGAYHGCTFGAVSLMQRGPFTEPFTPLLPGVEPLPLGDIAALEAALRPGDVAAVVVEPVQGEGGVRPLLPDYVAALGELTAAHGTLLVADEVQTGMGRSGSFLLSASWPRRPDVALLAKQLGGGLAPISAMLTQRELFVGAYGSDFEDGESHNMTMSGNALTAVAALAALELLSEELCHDIQVRGARFRQELDRELGPSPLFVETRGVGFMVGVQLRQPDHPWLSFEHLGLASLAGRPTIGPLLTYRLYRRGFFTFVCGHDWTVLRLQPRFFIEDETLAEFARACREELDAIYQLVS